MKALNRRLYNEFENETYALNLAIRRTRLERNVSVAVVSTSHSDVLGSSGYVDQNPLSC